MSSFCFSYFQNIQVKTRLILAMLYTSKLPTFVQQDRKLHHKLYHSVTVSSFTTKFEFDLTQALDRVGRKISVPGYQQRQHCHPIQLEFRNMSNTSYMHDVIPACSAAIRSGVMGFSPQTCARLPLSSCSSTSNVVTTTRLNDVIICEQQHSNIVNHYSGGTIKNISFLPI